MGVRLKPGWAAVGWLFFVAELAQAQGINVTSRGAELGADFNGTWIASDEDAVSADAGYRQWARFPLGATVLDPGFLTLNAGLKPRLAQNSAGPRSAATSLRQLDFDFAAQFFSNSPVVLGLSTTRSRGITSSEFGRLSSFDLSTRFSSLTFRNGFFPVTLSYQRRFSDNVWRPNPGERPIERSELVRTVRFAGRSTKTRLLVERIEYDDLMDGSGYAASLWSFDHSKRWGKGSRLTTNLSSNARETTIAGGLGPNVSSGNFSWAERVHLQHTRKISSDYGYSRQSADIGGINTASSSWDVSTTYTPTAWLGLGVSGSRRAATLNAGRQVVHRLNPTLNLVWLLPADLRFVADVALGFDATTTMGSSGVAPVVDERHTVSETRTFLLGNPFVILETVVVRDGAGSFTYAVGVDYRVDDDVGLAQVEILPGGRIAAGDDVLVSYTHSVDLERSRGTSTASYSLSVIRGGATLTHRRFTRAESDGQQGVEFGAGLTQSTTQLAVVLPTRIGRVRIDAKTERRRAEVFDFTLREAGGSLDLPRLGRILVSVGGNWRSSKGLEQEVEVVSARLFARWPLSRRLNLQGRLEAFSTDRSDGRRERFVGTTVDVNWRMGRLDGGIHVERHWRRVLTSSTIDRVSAQLIRRF